MSDAATSVPAAPVAAATPKKKDASGGKAKKPRAKPSHPKTSDMVLAAIKNLKERGGSSLQAIKKYIAANYKVDAEKLAPFIRKCLKSAVASGTLVQTKGKGASGSFKLAGAPVGGGVSSSEKKASSAPKPAASKQKKTKPAKAKSVKKPAAKKSSGAGSGAAASATPAKKPAAAKPKAAKTPSKAKKASKVPTKKPRAPKPKKAAVKSKSPKKAAPKKK